MIALIVINSSGPALAIAGTHNIDDAESTVQINGVVPVSREMVDEALNVLAGGLSNLSQDQRSAFLRLYDPSETGDIDEAYLAKVVRNYERIRKSLDGEVKVKYESESGMCVERRLVYTDLLQIHVCPYFKIEENVNRKARVIVHEVAHKALLAADRHYYRPTNKAYLTLTPNGSWAAQLPVIGKIFREIGRSDTLYHPDAYAHFAAAVYSGDYGKISE